MRILTLLLGILLGAAATPSWAQTSLADDLGYPAGTRLLVIHADDLGMSHSANAASFKAMTEGSVNSASIMMPTPWVPEVAAFAKTNTEADLGLHLTLTSEWNNLRWGPMSREAVPSLLDEHHYFHHRCPEMAAGATAEDVERELVAQVEQALRLGIDPTHFDTHMGCLVFTKPAFFDAYMRLGRRYDRPVMVAREASWGDVNALKAFIQPEDMLVDRVIGVPDGVMGQFKEHYDKMIRDLQPGVTVLLLHCGYDDEELRSAVAPQIPYGAAWRQEDFDYFSSPELAQLLKEENITLVTWRELRQLWKARVGGK